MEEVWKDISLSNLPPNPSSSPLSLRHTAVTAAADFHDFLAGDFRDNHLPHSPDTLPSPALSLSSGNHTNASVPPKRRATTCHPSASAITGGGGGGQRSWKKMIKNRESAARSRARKQAYTNELEMEVAHLARENAALRREQAELKMAIAAQAMTKRKLQRASSCSF